MKKLSAREMDQIKSREEKEKKAKILNATHTGVARQAGKASEFDSVRNNPKFPGNQPFNINLKAKR